MLVTINYSIGRVISSFHILVYFANRNTGHVPCVKGLLRIASRRKKYLENCPSKRQIAPFDGHLSPFLRTILLLWARNRGCAEKMRRTFFRSEQNLIALVPFSTPELFSFGHDRRRDELWGTLGPSPFAICWWSKQRKRFWLVNLWRGKIWTCVEKFALASWEFYVYFLCKSQIVHAIVKCAVFGRFSVCRWLLESRTGLLTSLLKYKAISNE